MDSTRSLGLSRCHKKRRLCHLARAGACRQRDLFSNKRPFVPGRIQLPALLCFLCAGGCVQRHFHRIRFDPEAVFGADQFFFCILLLPLHATANTSRCGIMRLLSQKKAPLSLSTRRGLQTAIQGYFSGYGIRAKFHLGQHILFSCRNLSGVW